MIGALIVVSSLLAGQIRTNPELVVGVKHPDLKILQAHQAEIHSDYEKSQTTLPNFGEWIRVDSAAAQSLFPNLVFYSISWSESRHPNCKHEQISLCGLLEKTVAVNRKTGEIEKKLFCYGNYEAFGELLIEHRIPLRTVAEARTVWTSFCEIHHRHWQESLIEKAGENHWELGISTYEQVTSTTETTKEVSHRKHYKLVETNPEDGTILSWKSVVETPKVETLPK